jgi:hypothetical protein
MLSANQRSSLCRIALLCYAILFSQTAHAALVPRLLAPARPHCVAKSVVDQPQPRKKLAANVKLQRPPVPPTRSTHFHAAYLPSLRAELTQIPSSLQNALGLQQAQSASHARLYVLRI